MKTELQEWVEKKGISPEEFAYFESYTLRLCNAILGHASGPWRDELLSGFPAWHATACKVYPPAATGELLCDAMEKKELHESLAHKILNTSMDAAVKEDTQIWLAFIKHIVPRPRSHALEHEEVDIKDVHRALQTAMAMEAHDFSPLGKKIGIAGQIGGIQLLNALFKADFEPDRAKEIARELKPKLHQLIFDLIREEATGEEQKNILFHFPEFCLDSPPPVDVDRRMCELQEALVEKEVGESLAMLIAQSIVGSIRQNLESNSKSIKRA